MPDAITPTPPTAPTEALPDWGTISADNDFISLGAPDQLSILDDWSAHIGGRLKEGGATEEQLGDLTAFVDSARSEIEHSSDSRRAVRDLSAGGAFADVALFEDGSLPSETQRALSAPMMGTELLASMGIPDVWNASTKKRQAADDFANMREELISKVGDSKLGDLIIARDQKRAELQGEFDAQREERDRLFDEVDKTQDPKERTALEKQISALEKKLDGLAIDLGLNKPGGEAAGTIAEMDKVVQDRQEQLRHADNGIDAKSSAASTFFSTWAKGSLESAPSRFTAWLFDKIYGSGKGDNVVEMMREQATKQQEQILAGRIPDGMSKAFVNPSLHETPAEQLARGTGHLMDWKTPMIFAGTPGFMAFGVGSAEQSYSDASKQTLAGGGSEHEATVNGLTAAAWTVPTLVAYMGMGKVAQALTSELLPLSATPLARAAVTFPVNVAANTVASGAIRKMQGEDFMPTNWIEHAVPDVMFALHSATEGYKSSAKIQKLTPTMEAVAAGTHPDILMRRMIADSPAFPDEVRTVALSEIAANQLAARKFLENTGRPIPAQQPLGDSEGAAQAQQRMLELAVERKQIMRRLNSPDEAPKPGDVARLAELQGEMKGLVTEALKRAEEPPAENKQEPEKKPAEEPAPARPTPGPDRAAVESTPLPEGFEPLRARLSSQLDDALADLEWAHNTSDPNEIASAETGLQFARSEWSAAMGQEGRGDVADNVRRKLAGGEYEWSEKGLQKKASAPEAASAPEKAAGPTSPPEAGETPREEAERLRSELGDEAAGKQHGLTPENVKDFYNGTNETGINPHGYGQDGLTMELERRISEQRQSAPAPEGTATAPAAEPKPEEKATAPAAQLADELTAEQHEKIERSVRAAADGFTWRNEAEKESAIAEVLTKVEAGARKMLQGTGSLEHFSAAVLARSRFTDVVRRAEQRRTQNAEGGNGEGEADKGWTQASQDESDGGAQDPSKQLADKEAAAMVLGFDKYTNKGGKAEDKAAAIKAVQKLVAEGVDATPTEVARELGWFTGSGDSQRPDITKVTRILKAASEDILRGTALKRSDVLGILPPGLSEVLAEITAAVSFGSDLWAQFRSPGDWTDWRSRLLRWSQRQQTSWQEVDNMIREARRVAPSEERRAAITNWIEANGDVNLLRAWESGSRNSRLRDGYHIAQNLTPEEIAYAQRVRRTYDELFLRGVREGLLDPASRRPNYVNHVWRLDNLLSRLVGSSGRRLNEYFRNAQARTFNTHFEGEQQGYRPRTKDVARLLAGYVVDMNNAIISRHFVRDLGTARGSDGRPLIAPEGRIDVVEQNNGERVYFVYPKSKRADQRDYRPPTRPHPAMMRWLWHAADEAGNPILVRDGFILHPEVWEHFNRIFGNNGVNDWLQATGQGAGTRLVKGGLRFVRDVQSMAKQTMLGFLSPFHAVQEGTHAVGHRVSPVGYEPGSRVGRLAQRVLPARVNAFFELPRIDLTASRLQRDAAAHGLMLQPDRVSENQFQEGLGHGQGNLVVNALRALRRGLGDNAAGRAPERLADLSDNFQHWLFHNYIPALKFKTYEHMLERNRARYNAEIAADPTFDSVVKYLSATQSNAAYGHLNYADLGRHPAFQTFLSIGLLAPDFLEARAKFVGQAIKGLAGRNGREQLQAIAFLALAQWSACRVLNKLTDDDWHFDSPFEVIHGARRYRMRSVPEDMYAALHDTRRFIYGRISPVVGKGVLQGLSGVNYRGEPVEFSDTVKELAASVIPLTMQPFTRELTKTGRQNPVEPWEQMAGSFGIHIARFSPLPAVYKLAADWKKKETGEDASRTVYPESKYGKLRYALEDGDTERAAREWEALLASQPGRPAYKFAEGFKESMTKPLTGSKVSDAKFRDSLKGKDRQQFDRAMERRQQIMHGFRSMHNEWIKAKEKAAAPVQGAAAGN